MTLKAIVNKAITELKKSGSKTAALDVKTILGHVLEKDDVYLLTHNQDIISNAHYQKFRRLIRRRKKGEPIAFLVCHKEFYGLDFTVNKNVLIPRPETEILVDEAAKIIESNENEKLTILDLGTGSGCIIISLANKFRTKQHIELFASDISPLALKVARKNAKKLGCNNIKFFRSDLFNNKRIPKQFDLVLANLPYLDINKPYAKYLTPDSIGLKFEPKIALYSDKQGLLLIEKLIKGLPKKLKNGGAALLEVDESQINKLEKLCYKQNLKMGTVSNSSRFKGFVKIVK